VIREVNSAAGPDAAAGRCARVRPSTRSSARRFPGRMVRTGRPLRGPHNELDLIRIMPPGHYDHPSFGHFASVPDRQPRVRERFPLEDTLQAWVAPAHRDRRPCSCSDAGGAAHAVWPPLLELPNVDVGSRLESASPAGATIPAEPENSEVIDGRRGRLSSPS
jgi:hypothetical protein